MFIGISSFFYHGTLSFPGQFLDVFSMYIFGTLLILGALIRRNQLSFKNAVIVFIISNIILGVLQFYYPEVRRILFALVLLPGIVLELLPRTTGLHWIIKECVSYISGWARSSLHMWFGYSIRIILFVAELNNPGSRDLATF